MNYLDANFATALHFNIRGQSDMAERFVRKNSSPFLFSELAEVECRRAFALRAAGPNSEHWTRLQSLLAGGAWRHEPLDWKAVVERARELIDRFGTTLKAGTLDTLHVACALHAGHVACALHAGCTRFLSFDSDSNARVLAASCRLKIYPELTAQEKGRVARRPG